MFLIREIMKEKQLKANVEAICKDSPLVRFSGKMDLKERLLNSKRRLGNFLEQFQELNFIPKVHEFEFYRRPAFNVTLETREESDSQIWITGHHDYCGGIGAGDNASALSVMIELAKYFNDSELAKNLVFASFDLEERGLIGSKKFASSLSRNQLQKIKYLINLECLGTGKDLTICTSVRETKSDDELVSKLQEISSELGYTFIPQDYNFFVADHMSFANKGVKTVGLASVNYGLFKKLREFGYRYSTENIVHSIKDVPWNLDYSHLRKVGNVIREFIENKFE